METQDKFFIIKINKKLNALKIYLDENESDTYYILGEFYKAISKLDKTKEIVLVFENIVPAIFLFSILKIKKETNVKFKIISKNKELENFLKSMEIVKQETSYISDKDLINNFIKQSESMDSSINLEDMELLDELYTIDFIFIKDENE